MKLPSELEKQRCNVYSNPTAANAYDQGFNAGALAALEHAQKRIEKLEGAMREAISVEFMWRRSSEILDNALEGDDT